MCGSSISSVKYVLFNLDSILMDTALSMMNALNTVLQEEGALHQRIAVAWFPAMHLLYLQLGFGNTFSLDENKRIHTHFLDLYA